MAGTGRAGCRAQAKRRRNASESGSTSVVSVSSCASAKIRTKPELSEAIRTQKYSRVPPFNVRNPHLSRRLVSPKPGEGGISNRIGNHFCTGFQNGSLVYQRLTSKTAPPPHSLCGSTLSATVMSAVKGEALFSNFHQLLFT